MDTVQNCDNYTNLVAYNNTQHAVTKETSVLCYKTPICRRSNKPHTGPQRYGALTEQSRSFARVHFRSEETSDKRLCVGTISQAACTRVRIAKLCNVMTVHI
jgi:hypothetical protein